MADHLDPGSPESLNERLTNMIISNARQLEQQPAHGNRQAPVAAGPSGRHQMHPAGQIHHQQGHQHRNSYDQSTYGPPMHTPRFHPNNATRQQAMPQTPSRQGRGQYAVNNAPLQRMDPSSLTPSQLLQLQQGQPVNHSPYPPIQHTVPRIMQNPSRQHH